jgi:hypothetical protein
MNKIPSVLSHYRKLASRHKKLPCKEERMLISLAKKGDKSSQEKLLIHLIGFFLFRVETSLFPSIIPRFGDDIIQECVLFAMRKIPSYNLRYKDKKGFFKKVCFSSYIWKGVTGVMLSYLKQNTKEIAVVSDNWPDI